MAPNQNKNGKNIARKWRYTSKTAIRYTFPFMLKLFQRKTQGFTAFDFISKETLFTLPFSKMGLGGLGFAMCTDGGTIYSIFLCASFELYGRETLKIRSQLSIKEF